MGALHDDRAASVVAVRDALGRRVAEHELGDVEVVRLGIGA